MITWKDFDELKRLVDQTIVVDFVYGGSDHKLSGALKNVEPFRGIEVGSLYLPFIGSDSAIKKISTENDKISFFNDDISAGLYTNNLQIAEKYSLRVKSFGEHIADKMKQGDL